jgi:hypothetical protein
MVENDQKDAKKRQSKYLRALLFALKKAFIYFYRSPIIQERAEIFHNRTHVLKLLKDHEKYRF